MAQENAMNGEANQAQLMLQKIYVKDASFEAPNTPQVFQEIAESQEEPQIQLNLNHQSSVLAEDTVHEVVLTLTVTCKLGEKNVYLVEVQQAGIFTISGFDQEEMGGILGSYCPNLLFPYARQTISSLVSQGGFPPILLQPINFDALYADQQRQASEAAANN